MMTRMTNRTCRLLAALAAGLVVSSCSGGDKKPEVSKKGDVDSKPTVYVPKPTQHYEGTPYWLVQSKTWPSLMEWTLGPEGERSHDSLSLRLSGTVVQSFVSGPKGKDHPIMCWFELTVRPIPKQLVGYAFNIDSVIFHDPIKKKFLPRLPMLSSERHTELGVVRTRFANNMAFIHSPDLDENQPLDPIIYLTSVDKKTIKITMPPLNVSFIKEIEPQEIPTDSLKWGPS